MAHKQKGQLSKFYGRARHLKNFWQKQFRRKERRAEKALIIKQVEEKGNSETEKE